MSSPSEHDHDLLRLLNEEADALEGGAQQRRQYNLASEQPGQQPGSGQQPPYGGGYEQAPHYQPTPQQQPTGTTMQGNQPPGVYVREGSELDVLWDGEHHDSGLSGHGTSGRHRARRNDRSIAVFFIIGAVVGILVTLMVVTFFGGGRQQAAPPPPAADSVLLAPIDERELVDGPRQQPASPQAQQQPAPARDNEAAGAVSSSRSASAASSASRRPLRGKTYTVQTGDTLSSIAGKFYDNSGPDYVEKIRRASGLDSADDLSLGQTLVIPPKDYE